MKKFTLEFNESQMRDHLQGLELLHDKCVTLIHEAKPFSESGNDIKKYFVEKQRVLSAQIIITRKLMMQENITNP